MARDNSAALDELYDRIKPIAEAMGGNVSLRLPAPNGCGPALRAEMPNDFWVDFDPSYSSNFGNALAVRAIRIYCGLRKSSWAFALGSGGWEREKSPLSDDEIRDCLSPEGPKPAVH
jgi:hypothetical protein